MEIDPQQSSQLTIIKEKKKKCRGNRKLQHFKRKCRSRGMTEEQITTIIHNRNNNNNISSNDNNQIQKKQTKKKNQFNKRKQSQRNHQEETTTIRSISQLSISQQQPIRKKVKSDNEENNMASDSHLLM